MEELFLLSQEQVDSLNTRCELATLSLHLLYYFSRPLGVLFQIFLHITLHLPGYFSRSRAEPLQHFHHITLHLAKYISMTRGGPGPPGRERAHEKVEHGDDMKTAEYMPSPTHLIISAQMCWSGKSWVPERSKSIAST